jgi:hypothetical protein
MKRFEVKAASNVIASCALAYLAAAPSLVLASGAMTTDVRVVDVPTRGVTERVLLSTPREPTATIVILTGGTGLLKIGPDGTMLGSDAQCDPVVRNMVALNRRGYAVGAVDAPTDQAGGLAGNFWSSDAHLADIISAVQFMRQQARVPVWVVGGGHAATSAVAVAGTDSGDSPVNMILYSPDDVPASLTSRVKGSALVLTHASANPSIGARIVQGLDHADDRGYFMLSGAGGACGAASFSGLDAQFIGILGNWIDGRADDLRADEAPVRMAIEYHNEDLDHYFVTHRTDEIAKLDSTSNGVTGWVRTGAMFPVLARADADTTPICRFYIPPAYGDSHFYGRGTDECAATARNNPGFTLEDREFFHMVLPVQGMCPAGTQPVYRLFDNRGELNHRYTVERSVRDSMVQAGWVAEGDGADRVAMCAPF